MDLTIKTTHYHETINFLDSQNCRFITGGVTIDALAVPPDPLTGLAKVLAGTFLAKVGDKYHPYGPALAEVPAVPAVPGVAAKLALVCVGDNNDIDITAVTAEAAGNDIEVALIDPAGNNQPLEVKLVNDEIRVYLATDGAGAITSTAADVVAAINGALGVKNLVSAAVKDGDTGLTAVTALAAAPLAGGVDEVPEVPAVPAVALPSCILAEDVLLTSFTDSGGVVHTDKVATAIDGGRVLSARLPVAPDAAVIAALKGITFV